jgi:hypothetical protein
MYLPRFFDVAKTIRLGYDEDNSLFSAVDFID